MFDKCFVRLIESRTKSEMSRTKTILIVERHTCFDKFVTVKTRVWSRITLIMLSLTKNPISIKSFRFDQASHC
jgi:hypothetical protein